MSHSAIHRLDVADRILHAPDLVEDGAWPRACTWLIRLALEHGLDDFWATHRPEVAEVSRRAQLLTLTRTVDSDLGSRATELWYALSRAAHHHAYELAPTGAELRTWHTDVHLLTEDLRSRSA
ncbi:hypothetical protein [Pseudonocardia pini]|uniref:hypothetical protein n=1 Tax=Pseudonocardia pini TaxID=2758030 RepID=UPI0015F0430D|nr:hypothetical protein [Pseudonocardia pini]